MSKLVLVAVAMAVPGGDFEWNSHQSISKWCCGHSPTQVLIRSGKGEEAGSDSLSFSSFWSCLGDKLDMSKSSRLYTVCLKTELRVCTQVRSEEKVWEGVTGESFREGWGWEGGGSDAEIRTVRRKEPSYSLRTDHGTGGFYTLFHSSTWQPVWQRLYYSHPHF